MVCSQLEQLDIDLSTFFLFDTVRFTIGKKVLNECDYPDIKSFKARDYSISNCETCGRVEDWEDIVCSGRAGPLKKVSLVH